MEKQKFFLKIGEMVNLIDQLKESNTVLTKEDKENYKELMRKLTQGFIILLPSGKACDCCEGSGIKKDS